jgi:hypothetical protein
MSDAHCLMVEDGCFYCVDGTCGCACCPPIPDDPRDARIADLEKALAEERARTDALIEALPKCWVCKEVATCITACVNPYCDRDAGALLSAGGAVATAYRHAPALRAILAARKASR